MVDDRDRRSVEGILRLRYIPSLDYVQVMVDDNASRLSFVDPASIAVISPGADPVADKDLDDPVMGDARWRRVVDLDLAIAEGLIASARARAGGTWAEMAAQARVLAGPLVEAGWVVVDEEREESPEYGDSVLCFVERAGQRLELELYEDGGLVVFDSEIHEEDFDPLLLSIDDVTVEECRRQFATMGWLGSL